MNFMPSSVFSTVSLLFKVSEPLKQVYLFHIQNTRINIIARKTSHQHLLQSLLLRKFLRNVRLWKLRRKQHLLSRKHFFKALNLHLQKCFFYTITYNYLFLCLVLSIRIFSVYLVKYSWTSKAQMDGTGSHNGFLVLPFAD